MPTGAWQRGSWDVPTQAIFTRLCPHRAVFWLRVAAWGAEPLPGLGVDSRSCEPRGLPCPGSISPSHLLKGMISVQRDLPRQWAESDVVGEKRLLFGEQSWYSGKSGSQKLDPTCLFIFYPVCCRTGVGPLGQQAPQLPSLNTEKTIIDFFEHFLLRKGLPGGSDGIESAYNAGDPSLISGLGRSPGEGNGNLLWYFCLENPMDRGVWWAVVHRVAKNQMGLSD